MLSEQTHHSIHRPDKDASDTGSETASPALRLESLDILITAWLARHSVAVTRVALGIVFLWFGILKFTPGWSPAEELATRTIARITFGCLTAKVSLPLLALWESIIGIGLLTGRHLRLTLLLLFAHMSGTLLPFILFPHETFRAFPFAPTLEGQYILKNLVLIGAAMVVGATVRGGRLTARSPDETGQVAN